MFTADWLITELYITGGAETFVRRLAPQFKNHNWDIRVIALQPGGGFVRELRQDGVEVIELDTKNIWSHSPALQLQRIWINSPPDIIHTHLYHASIIGRLLNRISSHSCLISHQHGLEQNRSKARSLVDRLTHPFVHQYVASCQAVADVLVKREHIPVGKISVIHNGIPSKEQFLLDHNENPIGFPQDLTEGAYKICCVGRLSVEKGYHYLIQALENLKREKIKVHVILLGDGPERESLQNLAAALGVEDQVTFGGNQPNVHEWMSACDIFIQASLWEGLSMALLEAMQAGLPVIATAVGGTPEVINHHENGLLVSPGQPDILAGAIKELIQDQVLAQYLASNARRKVESCFSQRQTLEKILALYESLHD